MLTHFDTKKTKLKSIFVCLLSLALFTLASIALLKAHSAKGTWHTDEPGIVLGSISRRSLVLIFKDAAYQAQPPLDYIVREHIWDPIGRATKLIKSYPELFTRALSLVWWMLPLFYLWWRRKAFSRDELATIYLALFFVFSSDFTTYYLAEARHYSAIAATYTLLVLAALANSKPGNTRPIEFFIASIPLPLLHIVSFPYYFVVIIWFLLRTSTIQSINIPIKKRIIGAYFIKTVLVVCLYFAIRSVSTTWQHRTSNLFNYAFLKNYLFWTIDWMFKSTPIESFFSTLSNLTLIAILFLAGAALSISSVLYSFFKKKTPTFWQMLLLSFFIIFPLNVTIFFHFAGMFTGERYSIAMAICAFLLFARVVVLLIEKTSIPKNPSYIALFLICIVSSFVQIQPSTYLSGKTDLHLFFKNNYDLVGDSKNIIILDTGGHDSAFKVLSQYYLDVPVNVSIKVCRYDFIDSDGKVTLDEWYKANPSLIDRIYLYGPKREFMDPKLIVWQGHTEALYKLETFPKEALCEKSTSINGCIVSCFKGNELSKDGRSVSNSVPHLDIYR